MRDKGGRRRRAHDDRAARQSLADIVVGIADHLEPQALRGEGTERLAGRTAKTHRDVVLAKAGHAELADNMRGQARADGALRVLDIVGQLHFRSELQRRIGIADHQRVQRVRNRLAVTVARAAGLDVALGLDQDRVQVEIVERGVTTADLCQQVGAADHLFQRGETESCENLAHLFGKVGEELHHLLRRALELGSQVVALRADTDRAGVGVALAHHDASHRDQRRGADAVFVGTEHRRHDDVAAGLQAAIGAQHDLAAQIVHAQHLMHFGQAHFPWQTGMLDRGLRARARAAAMSGHQNRVGLGLGHTGGNGADTGGSDQLHTDLGVGVDLLQVVDQLCQILDGIDVMVRRRRDQRHAGGRVAEPRDQAVDLDAGKLAALAGLCALRHLDLDFLAVVQIFRGHAETARGNLLDRAGRVVAILAKPEARRIFAALAGIGLGADAVHRDRQRLVRLGAERAERDARRDKPLADAGDGFDILDFHRLGNRLEIHQVAKIDWSLASDKRGIFLPALERSGVTGMLHGVDQLAVKGMALAGAAIAEEAANRQDGIGRLIGLAVHFGDPRCDAGQAKAGNPRRHRREIFRHKRA